MYVFLANIMMLFNTLVLLQQYVQVKNEFNCSVDIQTFEYIF